MAKGAKTGPAIRDELGRFVPGVSGNPSGRPPIAHEIRDLAQSDSPEAYAKVKAIMLSDGHKHQLAAAIAVLKIAGVSMTPDEASAPIQSNAPRPYSDKPTAELLAQAGVSSTVAN